MWFLNVSHGSLGNIQERLSVPLRVLLRVANAAAAEQGDEASPKLQPRGLWWMECQGKRSVCK